MKCVGYQKARRFSRYAIDRLARIGVTRVAPRIVRTLPHDERAFTQGLLYHGGLIYESTGGHVGSSLRRIDANDGGLKELIPIEGDFAEGIAVSGGRLFQLHWLSGKVRVYSFPELISIEALSFDGEGWGLASTPKGLIMSDGTSVLRYHDETFTVTDELHVRSNSLPIRRLNDLEWVGDHLYANVLGSSDLLEIASGTGSVTRIVDCSALIAAAAPRTADHVLNGIAYNRDEKTFFLTGKNWKYLFEVAIPGTG